MKQKWISVNDYLPEQSDLCHWYDDMALKFGTVWVTVDSIETGKRYTEQRNRLLIKMDPTTYKMIPEDEQKWEWSSPSENVKIIAWMPYEVPAPYDGN